MATSDAQTAARAKAWKNRTRVRESRAFAALQRDHAATGREEAAAVREEAAALRVGAAMVRDVGARTRDDAARVRDSAALVREQAAQARDLATRTREEATRRRLLKRDPADSTAWSEILELDRLAAEQNREAANHDRAAVTLDRTAAEKDRDAADRDREAAGRDREAAEKDRLAAEKDRSAADADRLAADSDRHDSEADLVMAEDQLSRADRLAALGRLAAGLAHEINNPLAAVLLNLQTIERELKGGSSREDLLAVTSDARLAGERVSQVIVDVRTWFQGESGTPSLTVVDLGSIIDDAVRLTHAELRPITKVAVELQPVPGVLGSPLRLGQVLTNLLLNAATAMTGGPDRNLIRIVVKPHGGGVRVDVSDTGSGITPEVLPYIFDPFFTTHEGHGGSGLGLAMCHRIVADHAGELTVESKVGAGTTFHVDLPAHVARLQPKVLLIDDDAAFCRSMVRVLSGCAVTVASNGREGLEQLRAPGAEFDVVLCDVMMPVLNGLEFYRQLSATDPTRAAAVIFVSGGATTEETSAFLESLPNVVLKKPFEIPTLIELIAERVKAAARSRMMPSL